MGAEEAFLRVTREFDELELIWTGMLGVAVPFDAPSDFKARILAAASTYFLGKKSVDNELKRYGESYELERPSVEERVMFAALIASKWHVQQLTAALSGFPNVEVNSGLFAAEACLIRLQASFKSAVLLIRQGYVLEASAVCRLILEQLAWAFAIHKLEDHSFFDLEPNRCITELKKLCPTAGKFYGSLSGLAHVHPSHTPEYLDFEGPRTAVLLRITHLRWTAVFNLMKLADWFCLVGEYVVFEHLVVPQSVRRIKDGTLCAHPKRPFVHEILKYAKAAQSAGAPIIIES
ncbi:MAG: hypothetical protein IV085_10150 [Thiobacillus sp.]|nr:hypothetical protein [Thiobacillus sp.]